MAGSRVARLAVALLCALGLTLAFGTVSSQAVVVGHVYSSEFGNGQGTGASQFSEFINYGMGIDVDETTGDVYIADPWNRRVQKFDANGNFILMWGFGVLNGANELQVCHAPGPCQRGLLGTAPGQMSHPTTLAVDNSNGPNKGSVYVADTKGALSQNAEAQGLKAILKYSPTGAYLGKIDGAASPGGVFVRPLWHGGVDVDNQGFVWVADEYVSGNAPEIRVMRFSNQANNAYVGGSQWTAMVDDGNGFPEPITAFAMAVAPDGSRVFLAHGHDVSRFTANGAASEIVAEIEDNETNAQEIGVDRATGNLFVGGRNEPMQEYDPTGEGIEPVGPAFGGAQVTRTSGIAVNGTNGTVYVSDPSLRKVFIFKPRYVPEATTNPATDVLHTTATLNGHTAPEPLGGGEVSQCKFQWGLTEAYEEESPCEPGAPIAAATDVSAELTGLAMESTYHFRIVVANAIDTEYGEDHTFTPRAVLELSTDAASEIAPAAAKLNASFEPAGEETDYQFEWGRLEDNLNQITPVDTTGTESGLTPVSAQIDGLDDYTYYYYRIKATNSLGTSQGPIRRFRTLPPGLPSISLTGSSQVTNRSAKLYATLVPNFGETIYGFEYGETVAYGRQVLGDELIAADDQEHQFDMTVSDLLPGRTYHFRAIGVNFGGISYGPDTVLTTLDVPGLIGSSSASVTDSSAVLQALVSPAGSSTAVHFEYGPTSAYGSVTPGVPIGAGLIAQSTTQGIAGLAPSTTYHFRAVATNAIGTVAGPDQELTTAAGPRVIEEPRNPKRCKKGFVKRQGKCVKRRKKQRRGQHRRRDGETRNATRGLSGRAG